jgi:hypothetical protein
MDMTTAITTTISATASEAEINEPSEGYGSADYTTTITVGDRSVEIPCWGHCGWLAPGANADIDGSGLSIWGDSQPGGWSVCDGDGAYDGRPRVIADRAAECGDSISVGATHLDSADITPDMVSEWAAALATLAATPEDAEEWSDRESDAADIRAAVVAAIETALEDIHADCPEPTGGEVWEALGRSAEVDGADCVRAGRWIGCPLVAWRDGEQTEYDWWPTIAPSGAVDAASTAAAEAASSAVEDAVAAILADNGD